MASFFDKMLVGINKGVNAVSETSKNIAEKAKLNVKISEIEKEINKLCQQIGALVYNLHKNGEVEIEKADDMFAQMDGLIATLNELQESVKQLEANKVQPDAPVYNPAPTEASAPAEGACTCGHVNSAAAKFCAKCGSPLQK